MGAQFSTWWKAPPAKVVMLGLESAGKSTIMSKMTAGEAAITIPTIGFTVETIRTSGLELLSWNVGGRDRIRPLWRHFLTKVSAIVFVVDSNDRERVEDARQELDRILFEEQVQRVPLLVIANKQDMPHALSTTELADKLGLHCIRDRMWYIQDCVAADGKGIAEGFGWLAATLTRDFKPEAASLSQSSTDHKGVERDGDSSMSTLLTQTMASKVKLWMSLL
mmetsp:Transcript_57647/g.134923  ORF Transcript_57647/g.134923 Transcript_57647/m.134923 type:complete len:222 (+) Transcript_57647:68-733(+)